MPTMNRTKRNREQRLRRRADRRGLVLRKSRRPGTRNVDDWGGYMLIDANLNVVVAGSRFDLDLADVEAYLS